MSSTPLVSIVIDNYNYGRFLNEAVDSALGQTYPNTEVIVVDDGSTDDSRKRIDSYGNRIKPVFKENGGQASAFNAGFRASRGELVCFLDADDAWLPDRVEKVQKAALRYPTASLIYNRVRSVSEATVPRKLRKPWPNKLMQGDITAKVLRSGGYWAYPPTSALSFRRSFLERVVDIPEAEYRICADAYLADLAPFFGSVVGLEEALTLHRLHGSNLFNNTERFGEQEKAIRSYLSHYETRAAGTNEALERLGLSHRVCLEDNWHYLLFKSKLGQGPGILALSSLGLRFAGEPSLGFKSKVVLKIWLEALGLWGGRQRVET
jgi:glycosyltransferase involved in cell wall biosynthesis